MSPRKDFADAIANARKAIDRVAGCLETLTVVDSAYDAATHEVRDAYKRLATTYRELREIDAWRIRKDSEK